ncbi:unnamed protein product, partial [Cuscuta epithymum]
MNNQSF